MAREYLAALCIFKEPGAALDQWQLVVTTRVSLYTNYLA
jgi:hypothetical protein